MALSIYLENGKVVVKSLATVNAAYDPAYFSPIQAKQYPTEGFLTATRVGTSNNLSITDANGKYIVYDLPYTEFKQKNGTTNIGSTVLTTVSTLNGTNYFGFDVDFNSSITSIDTRVGGAETTLTDVGKALRYDKNNGADPRGIYYDDLKSENDSFVTVESAKATIQGGLNTNVTVEELNGISYFKFNALDTAGAYSMITVTGKNQAGTLDLNNGTLLKFDNGTNNVSIGISSLTGNRSLFLPDASGTIALTSDIASSLWSSTGNDIYYSLGNVGIGTTTPSEALDVSGNIFMSEGSRLMSETTDPTAGAQSQSLEFFLPYRSNGTTMAENRSGLKLGGAKFFEPRTTNGSVLHVFGSLSIAPTNSPDKGGGFGIGFGNASDTYPSTSVFFSSWASFGSTTDRHFICYGYFGVRFEANGNRLGINGYSLGEWNPTGLGIGTNNPSAKLDVRGNSKLIGTVQVGDLASTGYLLPTADGTVNQIVTTDGAGNLSFTTLNLNNVADVDAASPTNGQVLTWDNSSGKWTAQAASGGGGSDSFNTIAIAGQSDVVADSGNDTLTMVAGSNMVLTTDAANDSITIALSSSPSITSLTVGSTGITSTGGISTLGNLTASGSVTCNTVAIGSGGATVQGTLTTSTSIVGQLLFTGGGTSSIGIATGLPYQPNDLQITSNGHVTIQLDADDDETAQHFQIKASDGTVLFQVDEDGVTAGLLTTATPTITGLPSTAQQGSTVTAASISNFDAAATYVGKVYNSSGVEQTGSPVTIDSSGGISFTAPSTIATGYELRIHAAALGKLRSVEAVGIFEVTASRTFTHWRMQACTSDGTPSASKLGVIEMNYWTATGGTGTKYPTTAATSYTSISGVTISAGHEYSSGYPSWRAFDRSGASEGYNDSTVSMWWTLGTSAANNWNQLEFSSAQTFQSVTVHVYASFSDATHVKILGSNTGAFSGEEVECVIFALDGSATGAGTTFTANM